MGSPVALTNQKVHLYYYVYWIVRRTYHRLAHRSHSGSTCFSKEPGENLQWVFTLHPTTPRWRDIFYIHLGLIRSDHQFFLFPLPYLSTSLLQVGLILSIVCYGSCGSGGGQEGKGRTSSHLHSGTTIWDSETVITELALRKPWECQSWSVARHRDVYRSGCLASSNICGGRVPSSQRRA